MPLVIFRRQDDALGQAVFSAEAGVTLGTGLWIGDAAPPGVAGRHAEIARSQTHVQVLIDFAESAQATRVNGVELCVLHALHHGDRIQLGTAEVIYWEVIFRLPRPDEVGGRCPFCTLPLTADVEVVACPHCPVLQHRGCWLRSPQCSRVSCQYPVRPTLRRALSPPVRFEDLEEGSALVRDEVRCSAGETRDVVPFQDDDAIAYCPGCEKPFHLGCWLPLRRCPSPGCHYDVEALLRRAFTPGADPVRVPAARRR